MFRKIFFFLCVTAPGLLCFSQSKNKGSIQRPALVIGVVVDQMRWDYLYRYYDLYVANGFKRLLAGGFSCDNTMIPYVPSYTAPGHACIYTGSVPAVNGIVGNNWYDRGLGKSVYCTDDSTAAPVGGALTGGKMSPRNLWTTTIGDELKLSNNFKSKVFGISIKDRASILSAGHSANGAFWYDDAKGNWITSTYYMKELPRWVRNINDGRMPGEYMAKDWTTLLPADKYDLSTADEKPYEGKITGDSSVSFPHKLSLINAKKFEAFKTTPFSNTYTLNLAKALIENEKLGSSAVTDFLAINIAGTDFIGHAFGPNSMEIEDTYLRLDADLANFMEFLDNKVGKGKYLFFLTADHGVSNVPGFLQEHNIPSGLMTQANLKKEINTLAEKKFLIKNAVLDIQNYQVYVNNEEIAKQGKDLQVVKQCIIDFLKQQPFVINAFETEKISITSLPETEKRMLINGYNPKRSGDIHFIMKAANFDRTTTGTTHGTWYPYDAHIPLVWFGWNVQHGNTHRETYMTDIAATLAAILKIQMPSGCVGKVIEEVVK